jgi:aspartokinase/homoserine dehydrogenase 1
VFRKLLISAREAGLQIDASDIEFEGFVPESLIKGHGGKFSEEGDEFYSGLEKEEKSIELLYNTAAKEEKKLRFIASFRTGASGSTATDKGFAAKIALEKIGPEHPFYNLEGSDNAVSIVTVFYPQGIVIKGAGAGAKQTAGGLLNDILKN